MNELLVKSQVTLLAHIALQGDTNLQRLTEIYTEILSPGWSTLKWGN